jgi:hypothetical protein
VSSCVRAGSACLLACCSFPAQRLSHHCATTGQTCDPCCSFP